MCVTKQLHRTLSFFSFSLARRSQLDARWELLCILIWSFGTRQLQVDFNSGAKQRSTAFSLCALLCSSAHIFSVFSHYLCNLSLMTALRTMQFTFWMTLWLLNRANDHRSRKSGGEAENGRSMVKSFTKRKLAYNYHRWKLFFEILRAAADLVKCTRMKRTHCTPHTAHHTPHTAHRTPLAEHIEHSFRKHHW